MAAKPKVFVSRLIPEAGLRRIKEACDAEIWTDPLPPPPEVLRQKVAACEGLVSLLTDRIDAALLDAAPRLRVVSNYAVGFNNIDVPAATAQGVAIGNTPGVLTDATADMAFCLLIAAARRVVEGHQYTLAGQWKTWEPMGHLGQDLAGRTLVCGIQRSRDHVRSQRLRLLGIPEPELGCVYDLDRDYSSTLTKDLCGTPIRACRP